MYFVTHNTYVAQAYKAKIQKLDPCRPLRHGEYGRQQWEIG